MLLLSFYFLVCLIWLRLLLMLATDDPCYQSSTQKYSIPCGTRVSVSYGIGCGILSFNPICHCLVMLLLCCLLFLLHLILLLIVHARQKITLQLSWKYVWVLVLVVVQETGILIQAGLQDYVLVVQYVNIHKYIRKYQLYLSKISYRAKLTRWKTYGYVKLH